MTILPFILIPLVIIGIIIRWLYIVFLYQSWIEVCVLYGLETDASNSEIEQCMETWPLWLMVGYFWVTDFRLFIVNQDKMHNILDYFANKGRVKSDE